MDTVTIDWKWKIGDELTHKAFRPMPGKTERRQREHYLVLGRMAEECPGGVQKFYRVRTIVSNGYEGSGTCNFDKGGIGLTMFHEEELAPMPELTTTSDTSDTLDAAMDAVAALRGGG